MEPPSTILGPPGDICVPVLPQDPFQMEKLNKSAYTVSPLVTYVCEKAGRKASFDRAGQMSRRMCEMRNCKTFKTMFPFTQEHRFHVWHLQSDMKKHKASLGALLHPGAPMWSPCPSWIFVFVFILGRPCRARGALFPPVPRA